MDPLPLVDPTEDASVQRWLEAILERLALDDGSPGSAALESLLLDAAQGLGARSVALWTRASHERQASASQRDATWVLTRTRGPVDDLPPSSAVEAALDGAPYALPLGAHVVGGNASGLGLVVDGFASDAFDPSSPKGLPDEELDEACLDVLEGLLLVLALWSTSDAPRLPHLEEAEGLLPDVPASLPDPERASDDALQPPDAA